MSKVNKKHKWTSLFERVKKNATRKRIVIFIVYTWTITIIFQWDCKNRNIHRIHVIFIGSNLLLAVKKNTKTTLGIRLFNCHWKR